MSVFEEYTIRILPSDRIRLTELALSRGKKPRSFAREILQRFLDQQQIAQSRQIAETEIEKKG